MVTTAREAVFLRPYVSNARTGKTDQPPPGGFFISTTGIDRMNDQYSAWAIFKAVIAWVGAAVGTLTLSKLVLFATLVFTTLQTYVLVRDKIWHRRRHR